MPQRVVTLKTDRKAWTLQKMLENWNYSLHEQDRSAGTVKKYTQAVRHFLSWYEQQEHTPLTVEDLSFGERIVLLRVRAGKGNKARSVPLNASAREAIATYMAPRLGIEKPSLKVIAARWPKPISPEAHEPIFLSQKGRSSHNLSHGAYDCRVSRNLATDGGSPDLLMKQGCASLEGFF